MNVRLNNDKTHVGAFQTCQCSEVERADMLSSPSSATKKIGPTASTIARVNDRIEEIRTKEKEIWETLDEPNIDLWKLRELCLSKDGLISDKIRQKVWPILVGLNTDLSSLQSSNNSHSSSNRTESRIPSDVKKEIRDKIDVVDPSTVKARGFSNQSMARSLDAEQIDRDVARCTWHLLTGSQRMRSRQMRNKHRKKVSDLLKKKQIRLGNLINLTLIHSYQRILCEEDKFRYFQGYHDIASIFLSTLGGIVSPYSSDKSSTSVCTTVAAAMKTAEAMGLYLPAQVLLKVSQSHFRDALRQNFQLLTAALKLTIMPLIKALDIQVFNHLRECEMEPFFALSWILTWFSHDVRETALVKRLFDVFIASHPLMPIYMAVAMVLHPVNRLDILGTECDFSSLHSTLSQLPRKSSPVGWKFIGTCEGGGYVSGDENDDETSSRLDPNDSKSWEENSIGSRDMDDEDSFAPSLASTSLLSNIAPVPVSFEEIIELSIHFMRRIPPRKLMPLARLFSHEEGVKLPLDEASIISLLQQPPLWTTASTAPSLQSIKIQVTASVTNNVRFRKKRKVRGDTFMDSTDDRSSNTKNESISQQNKHGKMGTSFAVIAAGLGPDEDGDKDDVGLVSFRSFCQV
jgi:hypothetical protein